MPENTRFKAAFRVIDVYDHPHGGRILRLRLRQGQALTVAELKGSSLLATDGSKARTSIRASGFAAFGGRVSDERLARTGRVDIHSRDEGAAQVETGWVVSGPA